MNSAGSRATGQNDFYYLMRTVFPGGAASQVVGCNLLPGVPRDGHDLDKRQAVILKETWLEVLDVSSKLDEPQILCKQPVHGTARSAAALPMRMGDLDVLIFTSDSGQLSVLYFDLEMYRLRTFTEHFKIAVSGFEREDLGRGFERVHLGNLVAADQKHNFVAVAALEKNIKVFSIDLEKSNQPFSEEKQIDVDGLVLSMCFLDGIALVVLSRNSRGEHLHVHAIEGSSLTDWPFSIPVSELFDEDFSGTRPVHARKILPVPNSPFEFAVLSDYHVAVYDVRPVLQHAAVDALLLPAAAQSRRVGLAIVKMEHQRQMRKSTTHTFADPERIATGQDVFLVSAAWIRLRDPDGGSKVQALFVSTSNRDLFIITDAVQWLGTHGPFIAMAGLAGQTLVMSGDGCDGEIRKVQLTRGKQVKTTLCKELTNLSPVSTFAFEQRDKELFVCSGLDETGSLRRLKVCLPFRVQSESERIFVGCNRLSSLRRKSADKHHSFLVLSYVDSGTTVFSVGATDGELSEVDNGAGFRLDISTVCVGLLQDGVAAQVHECGIRICVLPDGDDARDQPEGVEESFQAGTKISATLIKNGLILVASICPHTGPEISVYRYNSGKLERTVQVPTGVEISSVDLWEEKSLLVLGTHRPSIQLRQWDGALKLLTEHGLGAVQSHPSPDGNLELTIVSKLRSKHSSSRTPESVCFCSGNQPRIVANLRGGTVLSYDITPALAFTNEQIKFVDFAPGRLMHLRIGHEPYSLLYLISEHVWLVQFKVGRLVCVATSFEKVEGVIAFMSRGKLSFVKPRRRRQLTSHKILFKETPRRVLLETTSQGKRLFIVVSCQRVENRWRSTIRAFAADSNTQVAAPVVLQHELVHAIIGWRGFIVVGTSIAVGEDGEHGGRMLFYQLRGADKPQVAPGPRTSAPVGHFKQCCFFNHPRAVVALAHHEATGSLIAGVSETLMVWNMHGTDITTIRQDSSAHLRDSSIVKISCKGNFVVVGDRKDSVMLFQLDSSVLALKNKDAQRRALTDCLLLGDNLVLGADICNSSLFSVRSQDEPRHRFPLETAHFINVGETIVKLQPGTVAVSAETDLPGQEDDGDTALAVEESMLAMTVNGSLIALIKLDSADYSVFKALESTLAVRDSCAPLLGNSHVGFRQPTKGIVDGDMLQRYLDLDEVEQKKILDSGTEKTAGIEKTPVEVRRILENLDDVCM